MTVRRAEVLGAMSLATDLGTAQPLDHARTGAGAAADALRDEGRAGRLDPQAVDGS